MNFLGNSVEIKRIYLILHIMFMFVFLYFMVTNTLARASSWDEVDFALGVVQFDLLNMQPHFPGYPYFILGGMIVSFFVKDPVQALSYFNVLIYITSYYPIFQLAKRICKHYSLLVTSYVMTLPYVAVITVQPMSEGAALSVLWWYIWSLYVAHQTNHQWLKILPALFFSILLGIRLSYLPFGIGLVWFWIEEWKRMRNIKSIIDHVTISILFQLFWVIGLVISEGNFKSFISLSVSFVEGHFSEWGGAISSDRQDTIGDRLVTLVFENFLWTGIAGESLLLFVVYSIFFVVTLFLLVKKKRENIDILLFISFFAYFLWALLAQNIEKSRHILPLASISVLWVLGNIFIRNKSPFLLALTMALLLVQSLTSIHLIKKQSEETPAVHQLINFLQHQEEPFIIYTWEETRVMQYEKVPFQHKRILTYSLFLQDVSYYEKETVYLTNHVVEGFKKQGVDITNRIQKVADFSSYEMFNPVYNQITLYQWK